MKNAFPILLLAAVGLVGCVRRPSPAPELTEKQQQSWTTYKEQFQPLIAAGATRTSGGWLIGESTNKMDRTPEVILSKASEDAAGGSLLIRCSRGRTEVYVATAHIVDSGRVRVKLDDASPRSQNWSEASSHDALFAPEPIDFARRLVATDILLFEYHPLHESPATLEFKLSDLREHLASAASSCNWAKFDEARKNAKAKGVRDRLREAKIREVIAKYIEPCREEWLRDKGRWCWYDASDAYFANGGSPQETKEAAISDAVFTAKSGRVFVRQLAEIDRELKP